MATTVVRPGVVAFSVDLTGCEPQTADRPHARRSPTGQLAELFTAWNLPVTWVVDDRTRWAGELGSTGLDPGQEIAIEGDSTWAAAGVSRRRFSEELSARLLRARANGHTVETLLLRGARDVAHADLALKYGLRVICPVGEVRGSTTAARIRQRLLRVRGRTPQERKLRSIRFGLWQIAPHECWPSDGETFLWIRGLDRLRQAIDHTEAHLTVAHLLIDGAVIAKARRRGLRALEKVLRYADARRREGRLQIETLAGVAHRLSTVHRSAPSRSILRRAA